TARLCPVLDPSEVRRSSIVKANVWEFRKLAVNAVAPHDLTICGLISRKSVAFYLRRGRHWLVKVCEIVHPPLHTFGTESSLITGLSLFQESRNMANQPIHVVARTSTPIISFVRRNVGPCFGVSVAGICCFMYRERRNSEAKNEIKRTSEKLSSLRKKRTELEAGIERLQAKIRKGGETGMVGKESGRNICACIERRVSSAVFFCVDPTPNVNSRGGTSNEAQENIETQPITVGKQNCPRARLWAVEKVWRVISIIIENQFWPISTKLPITRNTQTSSTTEAREVDRINLCREDRKTEELRGRSAQSSDLFLLLKF
ncbi:K+ efflux antiporter 2, partial [Striga asiatica]